MDVNVRVMDVDVWVVDVNVRVIVYMSLPGCISLVNCCWDRRCRGDVVMPPAVAVPTPGDLAMCELIIIHHKTNTSMSGVGELFLHCRWLGYLWWLCWCWGSVIVHDVISLWAWTYTSLSNELT